VGYLFDLLNFYRKLEKEKLNLIKISKILTATMHSQ